MGWGISAFGHEVLGPGWLEGDDMGNGLEVRAGDLAQRALGDAFDQLVRVGQAASSICSPRYAAMPYPPENRISREAAEVFLESADNAIAYARAQLVHLQHAAQPQVEIRPMLHAPLSKEELGAIREAAEQTARALLDPEEQP